jgi:hypothetical protein
MRWARVALLAGLSAIGCGAEVDGTLQTPDGHASEVATGGAGGRAGSDGSATADGRAGGGAGGGSLEASSVDVETGLVDTVDSADVASSLDAAPDGGASEGSITDASLDPAEADASTADVIGDVSIPPDTESAADASESGSADVGTPADDSAMPDAESVEVSTAVNVSDSGSVDAEAEANVPAEASPDAMACTPQTTPCDWICQDCAPGNKCALGQGGLPACVAAGAKPTGELCGPSDDCSAGNICLYQSATHSSCARLCRANTDCQNGGECATQLTNSIAKVCTDPVTACNPVLKLGCSGGLGCYPVTPSGATGCHAIGTGFTLDLCESDYDCAPGWTCLDPGGGAVCLRLCRAGNDLDCSNSLQTCLHVTGWNTYGVCY